MSDKIITVIMTEEGNASSIEADATGEHGATLVIKAGSIAEATELLPEAEKEARKAMRNYTPIKKSQEMDPREKNQREMDAYEQTDGGKRFLKEIRNANVFGLRDATAKRQLTASQFDYIYHLSKKDPMDALIIMYRLGFKRGHDWAEKKNSKAK